MAVPAHGALVIALLAVGEPWNLAPRDDRVVFKEAVVALVVTFLLVLPAFAVFRYQRQKRRWALA